MRDSTVEALTTALPALRRVARDEELSASARRAFEKTAKLAELQLGARRLRVIEEAS